MKCPNCKKELSPTPFKGVRIDECNNCLGKWFDRGEFRKAKEDTDNDLRWLDVDLFSEKGGKHLKEKNKYLCPKDNSELVALSYMDSKVVVDKCSICHGVWLDNKEFEKIIRYLEDVIIKTPASEYEGMVLKEFREIFIGPESTISEIKDFLVVANLFSLRLQAEHPWVRSVEEAVAKYSPFR